METLAQSTVDPWASISVPLSRRRDDGGDEENDGRDEENDEKTTMGGTRRMTRRTTRSTTTTRRTTTGERSRLGKSSSSKRREDADEEDADEEDDEEHDDDEEDDDAADTEGEEVDAEEEDASSVPKRGTTKGRTTRRVAFQEEAENAALSSMGRTRAATTPSRPRKGIVRDEVEKINQRGAKAKPLSRDRTNEKGIRDSSEGSETASATHRALRTKALNSSDDSFITASIDPWGAPLVSPGTMRQVAKATKKRAQGDVPLSPQRYDAVQSRGGQKSGTTTTVAKKAKETKTARVRASQAFGSPTAVLTPANAPLRADTAEGQDYVCPGPPLPPPGECYLGLWRGGERARLLAYEACVQTCLKDASSHDPFTTQAKLEDMRVHFITHGCTELRKAFGLESILVGASYDEPRSPEPATRVTPDRSRRSDSMNRMGNTAGAGGGRWAAVTVSVPEVSIIDRGLKKYTHGWDPRVHGWSKPTEARGQRVTVRTEGGPGSIESSAQINVKQAPLRLSLGPGDTTLVVEVTLKTGKVAKAVMPLEELCRRSENDVVEMPLMLTAEVAATEQQEAYTRHYEKGVLKLRAVFEAAVGAGSMSAPPGAGTSADRSGLDWNDPQATLSPQTAYDFALGAALRALGFTWRRLAVHGHWELLLKQLADTYRVRTTYTSLRYVQHLLAVATPTGDCLSMIRDHLEEALQRQADGSLSPVESQMLNSIRAAVMTLLCVCFANYKSLDESEFRGITDSIPPIVPASAIGVSLELFKSLQRDPTSAGSLGILTEHVTNAARACFKKNKAVLVVEDRKLAENNRDLVTKLYVSIGKLCTTLKHELETDRHIQSASEFPTGFCLPTISSDVYCSEVTSTFKDALENCPPPAPPSNDVLDCISRSCELEASASIEEEVPRHVKLNTLNIFQPHIDRWVDSANKRLEQRCSGVLSSKGIDGKAIEECYAAMHTALQGFERIVTRWPEQALALERVLVGAERLIINKIAESVEHLHVAGIPKEEEGKSSKPASRKAGWMNIGRMKEGANSIAKRTQQVSSAVSKRFAQFDRQHGGMPPALAAALNALKSMELLRRGDGTRGDSPGECLIKWANNGGGAGPELGRGLTEALGELRAHYSGYLRRAVHGVYDCGPSLRKRLRGAKPKQDVEAVVAPILTYIDGVKNSLERKLPQPRAMVGVLRGFWDFIGAEALTFYEEDLRTNSTWHNRVLTSGAIDVISEKFQQAIRERLGNDMEEKDIEAPSSIAKIQAFSSSTARDSVQLY